MLGFMATVINIIPYLTNYFRWGILKTEIIRIVAENVNKLEIKDDFVIGG